MTANTLKITYGQRENNQRAARERLRRAESGEEFEEQEAAFVLNFEDLDDVERLMRRLNLQLLDIVASERPESIRETARLANRDYKEVHRNLKELEALGVIEFTTDGNSKRPILRDGTEAIDLSITFPIDTDTSNSNSRQETSA
ncbi:Predicted transcriptional regulator [Halogranum amylolyticum]|uniref:Predicted transcriptional regulator n=1 Tax=Halogranum amylolyticum TaxID=660520 RepID=A0A1H8VTT7_9EURY|nr:transcriptional regulator [Halogranum amylolyticum]SEP18842.1 Predicted transcriptional regulator [Halogranum amylolyticum]